MTADLTPEEAALLDYMRRMTKDFKRRGADGYMSRLFMQMRMELGEIPPITTKAELAAAARGLARKQLVEFWSDPKQMTHWRPN